MIAVRLQIGILVTRNKTRMYACMFIVTSCIGISASKYVGYITLCTRLVTRGCVPFILKCILVFMKTIPVIAEAKNTTVPHC